MVIIMNTENEILEEIFKENDVNTDEEDAPPLNEDIPDYEDIFNETNGRKDPLKAVKIIAGQNKLNILVSTVFYIIKALPIWFTPIVTSNIINIATAGEEDALKKICFNVLFLLIITAQNIFTHTYLYSKFTDKALRTTAAGLRSMMVRKMQHLSLAYHNETESGRIQSKFIRDIEAFEFLNSQFLKNIIPCIISVLISIGISASKNLIVTLFFMIVIPINVILVNAFKKPMKKANNEFRRENENISAKMSGMIDMLPVTKAHGLENEEIKSLEKNIKKIKEKGFALDMTNAYFGSFVWVLSTSLSALCLLFTSILAIKGKINIGDIVLYQSYFASITGNIQTLVNVYPEITKGLEAVSSVSELMNAEEIEENKGKISLRYLHGSIDFENVSFKYPHTDEYAIKNFNLNVKPGECIAVVGSSGSGKTTIMNLVIGLYKPTEGRLLIDGKNIDLLNLTSYRQLISVVPQNSMLFTGTIRENITYGLENVDENRLNEVIRLANIDEFINDMPDGVDTFIGENGGKLSGGQKQRISIARALIRDPKILILDEATSALDNISEYHVQQAMSRLIEGRTTFIVAHRLSTIRDADRIVVMENGEIVECGSYDELMEKKGKFYELKHLNA